MEREDTGGIAPVLKIRRKDPSVTLPSYETDGAAGMDIRAFLGTDLDIPPLGRARIPTGFFMEIPGGFEAQIRPRSGLAARFGITVLNAPGTIDCDYRGEVEVILINLGSENFTVKNGERIAQMVVAPARQMKICDVSGELSETKRGGGGFGSTGI
ncbi:MAG: dUTP diphosphatase [Treponema sp.]|jgi:dUTP pyrophosphatase|nr:dUTP diphosphatase [Treponema sp.]